MPTTFQLVETTFPNGEGKDTQEQINGVYDYLFVLLEQLRYTLFNLDGSNINQNALSEFIKNISEPIYAKIEDTDKNVNEISITAKGLDARLSDAEGDITQLDTTAKGLQASISNLDDAITTIKVDDYDTVGGDRRYLLYHHSPDPKECAKACLKYAGTKVKVRYFPWYGFFSVLRRRFFPALVRPLNK